MINRLLNYAYNDKIKKLRTYYGDDVVNELGMMSSIRI